MLGADTRATEGDIVRGRERRRVLGCCRHTYTISRCGYRVHVYDVLFCRGWLTAVACVCGVRWCGRAYGADRGQELPKDPLHGAQHLVLRCRHGVGHRAHHRYLVDSVTGIARCDGVWRRRR